MAWNNISKYLEKFFTITPPKKFYQSEAAKALNDIFRLQIKPEEIDVRFGVIYLKNQNPALKNEIFLNKEKIIQLLSQKIKNSPAYGGIKDIRF